MRRCEKCHQYTRKFVCPNCGSTVLTTVSPRPHWGLGKSAMVAVIVLSAITVPVGYIIWSAEQSCPPITVVPTGTSLSIQPAEHIGYNFAVTQFATFTDRFVYMQISADNGVMLYLMTTSQYSGYNSTGATGSHLWTYGPITSFFCGGGRLGCDSVARVPSVGAYYFVVSNPSSTLVSKVTVSSQVEVGPCVYAFSSS